MSREYSQNGFGLEIPDTYLLVTRASDHKSLVLYRAETKRSYPFGVVIEGSQTVTRFYIPKFNCFIS